MGNADLDYWTKRLQIEALTPAARDGRAQVLLCATDSKFKGIRFRELSFSVFVDRHSESSADAAFLIHAFNSVRFFAWVERACFSTPYHHAQIEVDVGLPASFQARDDGVPLISVAMSAASMPIERKPSRIGPEGFDGPLFLPGDDKRRGTAGKFFMAKLSGETEIYPFLSSPDYHDGTATSDIVTVHPSADHPALQSLVDSQFMPREWHIRRDATHMKSKTVRRSMLE